MAIDEIPDQIPAADSGGTGDRLNPAALTLAQAAKVLSAAGGGLVSEAMLQKHAAAGAPVSADGHVNLVHYAAWLNSKDFAHAD